LRIIQRHLFFGAVALVFIIGIEAQLTRPQFRHRVGATKVISAAA
jgi:hypothetical protein